MKPYAVTTDKAAKVGFSAGVESPLSQGVKWGSFVFCSGQGPLKPGERSVEVTDIKQQVRLTLENMLAVVEAAGSRKELILKCNCFLADMRMFAQFNEEYLAFFSDCPTMPARTTVEARSPRIGVLVEIECIAGLPDGAHE